VSDAQLTLYTVELSLTGQNRWTRVAEGTSAVTNGGLGSIDTTLLVPGTYDLRLQAFDAFGNVTTDERQVILDLTAPVGNHHFTMTDVSINLAGLPVTVSRTYDSFDRRTGDFGANWSMSIGTVD